MPAKPVLDPVEHQYLMHTRADTIRNRLWAVAATMAVGAVAGLVVLYLYLRHAVQSG